MNSGSLVDFAPIVRLAGLVVVVALLPLSWVWLRQRGADRSARLAGLTALALFLTFDLIVFGAFTRLTDSGLGCPDWPGCYGEASPFGATREIAAAEAAMPGGPVTPSKAWIEMIHRYLAATVGALIVAMTAVAWYEHRQARKAGSGAAVPMSPWWPSATLAWVVVQGLFGMYTVTLKLYPAIVTLHLLGGILLLLLLALQHEAFAARPLSLRGVSRSAVRRGVALTAAVLALQVALGGWVSTNYAVLACSGFPQCNGHWWPPQMDFEHGFTVLRHLGRQGDGEFLSFDALVAIHWVHRLCAVFAAAALVVLSAWLWRRAAGDATLRRFALAIAALTVLQVASGLSNVVLGWPIVAALLHTGGAAALLLVLTLLWARA